MFKDYYYFNYILIIKDALLICLVIFLIFNNKLLDCASPSLSLSQSEFPGNFSFACIIISSLIKVEGISW